MRLIRRSLLGLGLILATTGTDPANQIRGYRNEVRLHGLQGLQPAAAGYSPLGMASLGFL